MIILHIEHAISDFDTWKKAFESDPAGRQRSGVRHYQISRPLDNPHYVMIDLGFESRETAEAFLPVLHGVWQSAAAAPALVGGPETRIVEVVESKEL